jgi:hypothetical protein
MADVSATPAESHSPSGGTAATHGSPLSAARAATVSEAPWAIKYIANVGITTTVRTRPMAWREAAGDEHHHEPVDVALLDYASRAVFDDGRSLTGRSLWSQPAAGRGDNSDTPGKSRPPGVNSGHETDQARDEPYYRHRSGDSHRSHETSGVWRTMAGATLPSSGRTGSTSRAAKSRDLTPYFPNPQEVHRTGDARRSAAVSSS